MRQREASPQGRGTDTNAGGDGYKRSGTRGGTAAEECGAAALLLTTRSSSKRLQGFVDLVLRLRVGLAALHNLSLEKICGSLLRADCAWRQPERGRQTQVV